MDDAPDGGADSDMDSSLADDGYDDASYLSTTMMILTWETGIGCLLQ
jgi:hypothetical protein